MKSITEQIEEIKDISSDEFIEDTFLIEERKIIINKALKSLKHEYRQAIWLKYFENMSAKEIAVVMKKSQNSVEHLLSRARESLREILKEEDIDL